MTLKQKLDDLREKSLAIIPEHIVESMDTFSNELLSKGVGDYAIHSGRFPDANLLHWTNEGRQEIKLGDMLKNKRSIVLFLRGGWCPYCCLTIREYQKRLNDIVERGSQVIVITPQLPQENELLRARFDIGFAIYSDPENYLAKQLRLSFALSDEICRLYREFGIDLNKVNGDVRAELPIPATYLVNESLHILQCHIESDYTLRGEPEDFIKLLWPTPLSRC